MVSDNKHQKDALSLRIEFERLFGLEEVYVGRRTRDGRRQAPAGVVTRCSFRYPIGVRDVREAERPLG